jgi:hypothetical protein
MIVRDIPGVDGGCGLFVRSALRQGELIEEDVVFKVDTSHLPNTKTSSTWRGIMIDMRNDNLEARHVSDAMKGLDNDQLLAFRSTFTDATSDLQRFQIISYDICPVFGGPPFAFAYTTFGPYLNHSCLSNLQYSWDEASQRVHLRALTDITPNDMLTISYNIDEDWLNTKDRQAELHMLYDFACRCPLCGNSQTAAASDNRRQAIRDIQTMLKAFCKSQITTYSFCEAADLATQYVELVEQEIGGIDSSTKLPYRADVRLATA